MAVFATAEHLYAREDSSVDERENWNLCTTLSPDFP